MFTHAVSCIETSSLQMWDIHTSTSLWLCLRACVNVTPVHEGACMQASVDSVCRGCGYNHGCLGPLLVWGCYACLRAMMSDLRYLLCCGNHHEIVSCRISTSSGTWLKVVYFRLLYIDEHLSWFFQGWCRLHVPFLYTLIFISCFNMICINNVTKCVSQADEYCVFDYRQKSKKISPAHVWCPWMSPAYVLSC